MRTVINVKAGGKTRLSGVMAGVFLLVVLLGLGPLVGRIPNAVLAGILVTVGIGIIDYKSLCHLRSIPRSDALIMLVVLFITVFLDLLHHNEQPSVTDIHERLGIEQAVASHHLRILKSCNIVAVQRDQKFSFYSLTDPGFYEIIQQLR